MTTASPHRALRVRPWPVDPTTAHLVPYASRRIQPDALRRVLAELADAGYARVRTAALSPDEQEPFLAAGFEVDEHLHLLAHDLSDLTPPPLRQRASMRSRCSAGWTSSSSARVAARGSNRTSASSSPAPAIPSSTAPRRAGRSGCPGPVSCSTSRGWVARRTSATGRR